MHRNVNAYSQDLGIRLCKLDLQTYDVRKKLIEKIDRSNNRQRSEEKWYLGIMWYKLTASFGLNLTKVRFTELESGELEMSSVESEFQGMMPERGETLLAEVRTHYQAISGSKWGGNVVKQSRGVHPELRSIYRPWPNLTLCHSPHCHSPQRAQRTQSFCPCSLCSLW
jgi:hypothetical protein